MLVHRLATWRDGFDPFVVGPPPPTPAFDDVSFVAARAGWWPPVNRARRYGHAVARVLRGRMRSEQGLGLIEVHNRPELAMFLARRFAGVPVSLFLNNDPQGMRAAKTAGERGALLGRLAMVVCSSGYLRGRLLEGVGAPAREPVVLHNWLDLTEVPESPGERERVILFAGRVVRDKGVDTFVAACGAALADLPGWRAVMIGADGFGPHAPETPWLRTLRPLAAAAGVEMWGYRPHGEVMAAMARAAIIVVPSRWPEVFGAAGVAIDPEDAPALAAVIRELAGNPGRMAALGAAGRARAKLFDLGPAARRLDGLRRQVLAGAV